jgi:hypothetical protein
MQQNRRLNGLEIVDLVDSVKLLEFDLKIHEKTTGSLSETEKHLNDQLVNQTKNKLEELYRVFEFEK